VDDVDRSILAVLEKHGRISNAELAAQVGLSPSPCLRRVRRLEESGVIRGYRTLIDPSAIGRGLRVFAGARLARHARADVVGLPGVAMVTSYVTMKTLSPDTARPAGRRRRERPAT
jgi:DNA-binding Lrp family transcriptional regulator